VQQFAAGCVVQVDWVVELAGLASGYALAKICSFMVASGLFPKQSQVVGEGLGLGLAGLALATVTA